MHRRSVIGSALAALVGLTLPRQEALARPALRGLTFELSLGNRLVQLEGKADECLDFAPWEYGVPRIARAILVNGYAHVEGPGGLLWMFAEDREKQLGAYTSDKVPQWFGVVPIGANGEVAVMGNRPWKIVNRILGFAL